MTIHGHATTGAWTSADAHHKAPLGVALDTVDGWLESDRVVTLTEGPDHWGVLRDLLEASKVVGPKVHDGRIAALCQQHGVREIWSADRDFSRFPNLRTRNPLVGQ